MAKKSFSPQALRGTLIGLLVVVIAAGGGLFYLGLEVIHKYAIEVNKSIIDAEASGNQVQALQVLKGQLTQSEALIAKSNQVFTTPANYKAQASSDVSNYAKAAGITIAKTSFDDPVATGTHSIIVSLNNPVSYTKLIQFLDSVEGNIPKMQVMNIGIGHVVGNNTDLVNVDDIKITISTKE